MAVDWAPFVSFVRDHRKFLLTTHVRPDGDGLGSMMALADVMEAHGKDVRMIVQPGVPNRYKFLDPQGRFEKFAEPLDQWRQVDAVIVLDTGTWNQLGPFGEFLKTMTVDRAVIDHHLTQDGVAQLTLVDAKAEATGRLVHEAIQALGGPLPASAAEAIYVAIAMDTGWFRFSNTSQATFALAGELLKAGARADYLYDQLYESNTLGRLKLMGLVLDRLQVVADGKIALTEIRMDDYAKTGAAPQDTEDLVNFTRSVENVEVGLFFMEQPRGGVKVSFRSRKEIDVARIAEQFGGGGHRLASGATLNTNLEDARKRVLAAVAAALN